MCTAHQDQSAAAVLGIQTCVLLPDLRSQAGGLVVWIQ